MGQNSCGSNVWFVQYTESVEMILTIFVSLYHICSCIPELDAVFTPSQCHQAEAREGEFEV